MRSPGTAWALALALALVGCVGAAPGGAPSVTCGEKELRVEGTLDGTDVSLVRSVDSYAFTNKLDATLPGTVEASSAEVTFLLEFDSLVFEGGSSAARGSLMDIPQGLAFGNCETGGFVSTLHKDADGGGVHFTLRELSHEPFCGGRAVPGELNGCLGFADL
jgi:hypothetical protein